MVRRGGAHRHQRRRRNDMQKHPIQRRNRPRRRKKRIYNRIAVNGAARANVCGNNAVSWRMRTSGRRQPSSARQNRAIGRLAATCMCCCVARRGQCATNLMPRKKALAASALFARRHIKRVRAKRKMSQAYNYHQKYFALSLSGVFSASKKKAKTGIYNGIFAPASTATGSTRVFRNERL